MQIQQSIWLILHNVDKKYTRQFNTSVWMNPFILSADSATIMWFYETVLWDTLIWGICFSKYQTKNINSENSYLRYFMDN